MNLLKEHLFDEDCEEEDHDNWFCLLSEMAFDEGALEHYQDEKIIVKIDHWHERVEDDWHFFGARIFRHEPSGQYFWIYEHLKGGDGSYSGTEDYSWIELGNGTIADWIDKVKHKEAVVEKLP
jgi:hypothetical protein